MDPIAVSEPHAFEVFFEGERRRLLRALYLLTGNAEEAQEVLQDAFVAVWERWDRVSAMDDPTGYLYRTALNRYRSGLRRTARAARAERVERAPTFHEIRTRRERRQRRSAYHALAAGLCIAVLGTVLAYTALRPDAPRPVPASYQPPEVPYLWPENWSRPGSESPVDVQSEVDAGETSLQWRTDPEQVAARFAQQVLGRGEVGLRTVSLGDSVPGLVFELKPSMDHQQYVWVRQPVREGKDGVWVVAAAWADTLDTGIGSQLTDVTETVPAGASLHMDLSFPDEQHVVVGVVGGSDCSTFFTVAQQGAEPSLGPGEYTLALPRPVEPDDPQVSCGNLAASYSFAYTVPSRNTPTGDPFLESGDVLAVTAIPFVLDRTSVVTVPSSPGHHLRDTVTVACDETTAWIVGSETVKARPDGVHVFLENPTSERMSGYPSYPDERTYALLQGGMAVGWVTYLPDVGGMGLGLLLGVYRRRCCSQRDFLVQGSPFPRSGALSG